MFMAASGSYGLLSSKRVTSNRCKMAVVMAIPSYVASARPRQLRGPAFQEWYSTIQKVSSFKLNKGTPFVAVTTELTERAIGYRVTVLGEPSAGIEYGSVFPPNFRHSSEDKVLITNDVASI